MRVLVLAVLACLGVIACGESQRGQGQGGQSGSATTAGGATSGASSGGASSGSSSGGKSSGGTSATAGAAGFSSLPPNACQGSPIDCIPLCQGGMCDCYCEHAAQCITKPEGDATCNNCYFDHHCGAEQRCYGAACGMQVDTPAPGTCRTPPGGDGCWGKEDCGTSKVCVGAQVCECGSACLVADMPGTCQAP